MFKTVLFLAAIQIQAKKQQDHAWFSGKSLNEQV